MEELIAVRIPEAARRIGVSPRTVQRWVRAGRLRAVQPGGPGTAKVIPVAELRRLLDTRLAMQRLGASRE